MQINKNWRSSRSPSMEENTQPMEKKARRASVTEELNQLRYLATPLVFKEDWVEYINLYTNFISSLSTFSDDGGGGGAATLRSVLRSALCNRAEALFKLQKFSLAFVDCNQALEIEPTNSKALLCKGKLFLELGCYSQAALCFNRALISSGNTADELLRQLLERSRRLEVLSKSGALDISEWVLSGFQSGRFPELAQYIGPVEVRKSKLIGNGGRGLFAVKNVEAGRILVVAKAVVIGRGILPEPTENDRSETARMVMWKDFVGKTLLTASNCKSFRRWINVLSAGENEDKLEVPEMSLFNPSSEGVEEEDDANEVEPDKGRILKVLDVNCLMETSDSAKVLGKNIGYSGVGLWILPSFINHSCNPNARRLHIGDWVVVHASREIKSGEEITFAYFDILTPLANRRAAALSWGFPCDCERCRFETAAAAAASAAENGLPDLDGCEAGEVVMKLEGALKLVAKRKTEKGFLRASFWAAYASVFHSERSMSRLGRRLPTAAEVAESVSSAVGAGESVLKMLMGRLKKRSCRNGGVVEEMEMALKIGEGVYSKVMKKQAMRALLELL